MTTLVCVGAVALLTACGGESHQDLRVWMSEQGKGARGKLDPLPQIKPYDPFAYNAFDLPDPFKPRKIEPTKGASKLAPDLTRRKEPLEAYPLESLVMAKVAGGFAGGAFNWKRTTTRPELARETLTFSRLLAVCAYDAPASTNPRKATSAAVQPRRPDPIRVIRMAVSAFIVCVPVLLVLPAAIAACSSVLSSRPRRPV